MKHTARCLTLTFIALLPFDAHAIQVSLHAIGADAPCAAWGLEKLKASCAEAGIEVTQASGMPIEIHIGPDSVASESARKPEGFQLTVRPDGIRIAGYDPPGVMYGCLELARRIRDAKGLPAAADDADSPAMTLRGTCILLMKLGLYDYPVTPDEFPFFYDKDLWTEYLDFLAENRFNYIAFWNGHPFDYFVKLDQYPEAQDGLDAGLLERNHEMLMWLAHEAEKRNIWLMFEFYNIHVSVYFAKAHKLPEHGINEPSPLLRDYTGYCIERFVSEFPSVGLYICPGEALEMKYTPDWINNVIFAAVKRAGKTPPIMIRSWGIDLEHMKQVVGNYPRLYTERKFNVEMIAGTDIDPENEQWTKLSGNHVVNIHCMGNLEPFRWSPPSYIQKCVQSSLQAGATGLHLYPRKAWRWPYGCDKTSKPELQWRRDWMWFEAWGRYAWNANRDDKSERAYWLARLEKQFGGVAQHVLNAFESSADVLPAIQRLVWRGNDNHTVVGAGVTLDQLATAKGIPFLPLRDTARIPEYLDAVKSGNKPSGGDPVEFLDRKAKDARRAVWELEAALARAECPPLELNKLLGDMQAMVYVAQSYRDKLQAAAAKAAMDGGIEVSKNATACVAHLAASLQDFRNLTALTVSTYESMSDVPAWNPTKSLPCPYHWSDVLPVYEAEYVNVTDELKKKVEDPAALELSAAAGFVQFRPLESIAPPSDVTTNHVLPLVAHYQSVLANTNEAPNRAHSMREKLLDACGLNPMPERTPLNAQTAGHVEYPQYTLEKIVYEAWPGIPVSAHLYLPKGATAPLPCVLYTCGHWYHGKTERDPRSFCVGMVQKGVAVLIYDPMGQGERFAEGEHGHRFPILEGLSQEGFMVWESMRAIDYLGARPEIDPKRIGMTGASGGGLNTVFTAAVEDRLAAATPVCYPTSYDEFLCAMAGRNWNGGVDLCNQVPGVITFARTSDLMGCVAPKPLLQISATEDSNFTIAGSCYTARGTSQIYNAAGAPDAFKYVEVEAPHGYDKTMREAAYGFFLKALAGQGDGSPSAEPSMDFEPWDDSKLRCFPDGKNHLTGPLLPALVKSRLPEQPVSCSPPEGDKLTLWQRDMRPVIREICKVPSASVTMEAPHLSKEISGGIAVSGLRIMIENKGSPSPTSQFSRFRHYVGDLSITRAVKANVNPKIAFVILSKKDPVETISSNWVRDLISRDCLVDVAQLTGLGKNAPDDFETATNLWMLDQTLPGEWIAQIECLLPFLRSMAKGVPICLVGIDGMAETALLAAAVTDEIDCVAVDRPLVSYRELISDKVRWDASVYLPRVLRYFDLPQVVAAIAPRAVVLFNPVNALHEPCSAEEAEKAYAITSEVFASTNAPSALHIVVGSAFDADTLMKGVSSR